MVRVKNDVEIVFEGTIEEAKEFCEKWKEIEEGENKRWSKIYKRVWVALFVLMIICTVLIFKYLP